MAGFRNLAVDHHQHRDRAIVEATIRVRLGDMTELIQAIVAARVSVATGGRV